MFTSDCLGKRETDEFDFIAAARTCQISCADHRLHTVYCIGYRPFLSVVYPQLCKMNMMPPVMFTSIDATITFNTLFFYFSHLFITSI